MFCFNNSRQLIQYSKTCYSTAAKGALATLRKETGFSIKNCKTALEMNSNDLKKATAWLNDEAQKQGWERATKLQNRVTSQGLVGIHVKNGSAALVEVCCETDFVSRNVIFKDLVKLVTNAAFDHKLTLETEKSLSKKHLCTSELNSILSDGKNLGDHAALAIAQLGENIVLRRGLHLKAGNEEIVLCASVHPAPSATESTFVGNYGAVVALKPRTSCSNVKDIEEVGRKLCMHVIGMKPKFIKSINQNLPQSQKIVVPEKRLAGTVEGSSEDYEDLQSEAMEEDSLLAQAFVFEPESSVQEVLLEKGLEVVHFERFERGEVLDLKDV